MGLCGGEGGGGGECAIMSWKVVLGPIVVEEFRFGIASILEGVCARGLFPLASLQNRGWR